MPLRTIVTTGTTADCSVATELLEGFEAEYVLADKGYDSQKIIDFIEERGGIAVIPPRKNRKVKRDYDAHIYRTRHLVENAFLRLKEWRGIATRYAKNVKSYEAIVHIRCLFCWLKIL